jgi:hypothetical protein
MKKLLVPRRRLLKAAAVGIAMPYVRRVDAAAAFGGFMVAGSTAFPGQSGNPVGFAAAPGFSGFGAATTTATYAPGHFVSGSSGSPTQINFIDFDPGGGNVTSNITNDGTTGGTAVSWITFNGCRFQSNATGGVGMNQFGSSNIVYNYCSFVPRTALSTAPPGGGQWPSNSVGIGVTASCGNDWSAYGIPYNSGYQKAFQNLNTGTIFNHCDFWGWGNCPDFDIAYTAGVTIKDCWFHDARMDGPVGAFCTDHTDSVAYTSSLAAPGNITVNHCTIASIGNTNGIGFQNATTPYNNIAITNCYISGFGQMVDMCHNVTGNTNLTFTDNILATDLMWNTAMYQLDFSTAFSGNGNLWRRNKFRLYPGSGSSYASAYATFDGMFCLPKKTGTLSDSFGSSDWNLGP